MSLKSKGGRQTDMSSEENEKYRCPCCGYKTLDPPRTVPKYARYASGKTI